MVNLLPKKSLPIIFIGFSTLFSIFILFKTWESSKHLEKLEKNGITSTATVYAQNYDDNKEMIIFWFKFKDQNGKEYSGKTNYSNGSKTQFEIGEKVEIIYLKDQPKKARLNNYMAKGLGIHAANIFCIFILLFNLILGYNNFIKPVREQNVS